MGEPAQEICNCECLPASVVVDSAINTQDPHSASHVSSLSWMTLVPTGINKVAHPINNSVPTSIEYSKELPQHIDSSTVVECEFTEVPCSAAYTSSTVLVPMEYSGGLVLQAMATLVEHSTLADLELQACKRPQQVRAGLNTQTELVIGQSSLLRNTQLYSQCAQETGPSIPAELVIGK